MKRETSTPGPEIGWAFGLAGFVVSVFVGWLLSVGVGFVLFMVVLWGGLGALFAFLVERSSLEERDRVEELRNTRLGTLQALVPVVEAVPEPSAGTPSGAPAVTAAPGPLPDDLDAAGRRETREERRARRAARYREADELAAAHAARMVAAQEGERRPPSSTDGSPRTTDAPVADAAAA